MAKRKKAFNDNRDLHAQTARIYQADWDVLQRIAMETHIRPEAWARAALGVLMDAYQRDGYLVLPLVMVPIRESFKDQTKLVMQVEQENKAFAASEATTVAHTFRYLISDLELLEKLSSESSVQMGTYLRLSLHLLVMMYLREGEMRLPTVVYSLRNFPKRM
jgi:predicted component of type VI protein secretion system